MTKEGVRLAGKIVVLGSLNMDMVINMVKMPALGETIKGSDLVYVPGGKGANQACAAGRLGGRVVMMGCVGTDSFGRNLIRNLEESGVDAAHIEMSRDKPTGTAVVYVDEAGNNSITVVAGANDTCTEDYISERQDILLAGDCVLLQMEIPFNSVFFGIKKAKELGKTVILNPAPAPSPDMIPSDVWECIDYLTPNETELMKLSGETEASMECMKRGAARLLEYGVKNVLVTLGAQGALLVNGSGAVHYPGRAVEAVDTTAAGDCFNGGLAVCLTAGMGISEAVAFANAAASIAVTRKGAQSSIPSRHEVELLLKERE